MASRVQRRHLAVLEGETASNVGLGTPPACPYVRAAIASATSRTTQENARPDLEVGAGALA
ncbi:hypothetical protein [Rubrivirga sp.]|uniref:hypothetical protein n=1 Tax=Rubrivirga sp. TaxID=1885344 RepID=UPI003C787580